MSVTVAELSRRFGVPTASGPLAAGATLPVDDGLAPLLGSAGLRKGTSLAVRGRGALSLAVALAARCSAEGHWCAAVGVSGLGLGAVVELGMRPERLVVIPDPGPEWPRVLSILIESIDLLIVRPPGTLPPAAARRLAAKLREREAVLIALDDWPGAQARLDVLEQSWRGLGRGSGRLTSRQLRVSSTGRGTAAGLRDSRKSVWLPGKAPSLGQTPTLGQALPAAPG